MRLILLGGVLLVGCYDNELRREARQPFATESVAGVRTFCSAESQDQAMTLCEQWLAERRETTPTGERVGECRVSRPDRTCSYRVVGSLVAH